ncbi:MAG: hypothetical protein NVSMB31_20170 [Vulcanimicrobiaceae bacterium]
MSTDESRETERFVLALLDPADKQHGQWNDALTKSWNALAQKPVNEIVAFIREARKNGVHFRSDDDTVIAEKIHHFGTLTD